jgi:hypothetical protein
MLIHYVLFPDYTEERCLWCLGTVSWLGAHWCNLEAIIHSQSGSHCYLTQNLSHSLVLGNSNFPLLLLSCQFLCVWFSQFILLICGVLNIVESNECFQAIIEITINCYKISNCFPLGANFDASMFLLTRCTPKCAWKEWKKRMIHAIWCWKMLGLTETCGE